MADDKKPFYAKIHDNFVELMEEFFRGELSEKDKAELRVLADRIAGKVVELTFVCGDAFEKIDNNWWLPNCTWEPVKEKSDGLL